MCGFPAFLPNPPMATQLCLVSKFCFWMGVSWPSPSLVADLCLYWCQILGPKLFLAFPSHHSNEFFPVSSGQEFSYLSPRGKWGLLLFKSNGFLPVPLPQCLWLLLHRRGVSGEGVEPCAYPPIAACLFLHPGLPAHMPVPPQARALLLIFLLRTSECWLTEVWIPQPFQTYIQAHTWLLMIC